MKGKCKHSKNGYCNIALDLRCEGCDENSDDCEEYEEEEDNDD